MPAPRRISVIDLLRRRRELATGEVARLLAGLPAILDGVAERPVDLLRALRVEFDTEVSMEAPVESWPEFRLVLDEGGFDGTTVLMNRLTGADAMGQLAGLVYELLGGPRRDTRDFSPVASLGEAGNAVLRRALNGGAFANCEEFWRAWLETLEVGEKNDVLELVPADGALPTARLVARAEFRIGRSRKRCDWPARVEVGGVYDAAASERVSRVHVVGEWRADGPIFRDGDDGRPSANGTTFNGVTVAADEGHPIGVGGILALGGEYRLDVRRLGDAVIFRPLDGRDTVRDAVWVRSEIAFSVSPDGRLVWGEGAKRLRYRNGRFWIDGELSPLNSGQSVELGAARFLIRAVSAPE